MAIGSTFTYDEVVRPFFHSDVEEDWEAVTRSHTYEDGGRSFNELSDTPPKTWRLSYTGLTAAQAADFDTHYSTYRTSRAFTFVDKWGNSHTNVYYRDYQKSHDGNKSWIKSREIVFIKYP